MKEFNSLLFHTHLHYVTAAPPSSGCFGHNPVSYFTVWSSLQAHPPLMLISLMHPHSSSHVYTMRELLKFRGAYALDGALLWV